jgi:hypothetical protein
MCSVLWDIAKGRVSLRHHSNTISWLFLPLRWFRFPLPKSHFVFLFPPLLVFTFILYDFLCWIRVVRCWLVSCCNHLVTVTTRKLHHGTLWECKFPYEVTILSSHSVIFVQVARYTAKKCTHFESSSTYFRATTADFQNITEMVVSTMSYLQSKYHHNTYATSSM